MILSNMEYILMKKNIKPSDLLNLYFYSNSHKIIKYLCKMLKLTPDELVVKLT